MTKNKESKKGQNNIPIPKLKTKQWIAFALALFYNYYGTEDYGWPDPGILNIPLAIICAFGVVLGEPLFKLLTPQEHYIKRAKINLLLSEFFYCLTFGIVPNAVILFVFF